MLSPSVFAQEVPTALTTKPRISDTTGIIINKNFAKILGKALFWDIEAGSDGNACATCHFHAGADIRIQGQVNPGHDSRFGARAPAAPPGPTGPNKKFTAADFPFRQLADVLDRQSAPRHDSNDRFSSAGTFAGEFISVEQRRMANRRRKLHPAPGHRKLMGPATGGKGLPKETCNLQYDPANNPFHARGKMFRKAEPRQTPSVINAAYSHRQFWDGRANHVFNGVDPFGRRTNLFSTDHPGVIVQRLDGSLRVKKLALLFGSLASQAVGPPLSDFEMSCAGRVFADIGHKLLSKRPLGKQKVHPEDSLFSRINGLVATTRKGLNTRYASLVKRAFHRKYWDKPGLYAIDANGDVVPDPDGYTQMELNFAMIWGLAIQEYEATLFSERSPFDRSTLSNQALRGFDLFKFQGRCVNCHKGPLFNGAKSPPPVLADDQLVERMILSDNRIALYDNHFYNIGVRPASDDVGVGGVGPYGNPLSFTRQFKAKILNGTAPPDPSVGNVNPCIFEVPFSVQIVPNCGNPITRQQAAQLDLRDAVDGAFKVPTLRNVGLNPPYFHNGGQATLRQVVEFYNRGGDRHGDGTVNQGCTNGSPALADTTGFDNTKAGENNCTNLDADILPLNLTSTDIDDLVQFLLELTDRRVACHSGKFDHPALPLSIGNKEGGPLYTRAKDIIRVLPAVGRGGLTAEGKPCFPNTGNLFGEMQAKLTEILLPAPPPPAPAP